MRLHVYEDGPRFATAYDPLTNTPVSHCIPGCVRVDDSETGRALLRVPVYWHRRAQCADVYELWKFLDTFLNPQDDLCLAST